MPSLGQIIPAYAHPHVATYINDNTIPTPTANTALDPVRLLQVFVSGKGRDNQIIESNSLEEYLSEFGNPNYFLYGQPGYMPAAALAPGNAKVYCMRVLPDDAIYSNIIIVAKVRVDTSGATPFLDIKLESQYFPDITNADEFGPVLEAIENTTPDVDGYKVYPLFVFHSAGRGIYGDNYRVRISSHTQADKDNEYKNYRIEIFTTENGFERIEMFEAALYPDAIQARVKTSYFMEDVINEKSTKVKCIVHNTALESIYNIYKAAVAPDSTYTLKDIDILFGINKYTAEPDITIQPDKLAPTAVSIDRIEGVAFVGGSDGAFSISNPDPDARNTAINAFYVKAFKGELDKKILSKRRVPCELMLDANYEDGVKRELINLVIKRYDAYCYIDAGLLRTQTEALEWADYMQDLSDRIFSKECHHYKIKDIYTGKIIPVTTTYFLASVLPTHFKTVGNQVPLVGELYGKLTGYVKNSLLPVIDADDFDTKEDLYNFRVNYFEAIAENVFIRGTQTTSQFGNNKDLWSDLSEENNMHVLLEMKRIVETYVASKLYNFGEYENRKQFTEDVNRAFQAYTSVKVRSFVVKFEMNPWEEERSILHCYLELVFRNIVKRGIVEIDINKRV